MSRRRALIDRFYATAHWPLRKQLAVAGVAVVSVAAIVGATIRQDHPTTRPLSAPSTSAPTAGSETSASAEEPATSNDLAPGSTSTPLPASTSSTSTLPMTTPTAAVEALAVLAQIPIEREHRGGYDRDLFAVWSDLDDDGCDTRSEVLFEESLTFAQVDTVGCQPVAGDWLSSYDGILVLDASQIDIDHVVALKEAWDSGAWAWQPDRRIAYANDVSDVRTLAAVTAESNRSKGDADPSNWLPADDYICQYLSNWVAIKARWSLSMDESEHGRVRNLLRGDCAGTLIEPWSPAP